MSRISAAWSGITSTPKRAAVAAAVAVAAVLAGVGFAIAVNGMRATAGGAEVALPTPAMSSSADPDAAATATVTRTPTPSPTPSATPSPSPTAPPPTPSPTASPSPTPRATPSATPSPSPAVPSASPTASPPLLGEPQPQLTFVGTEDYSTPEGDWTRYDLTVENWQDYPAELFEISSAYPCGLNPTAGRTVVEIYDRVSGAWLYGFCALPSPDWLTRIWFAVPRGEDPPATVQVVLNDQLTGEQYLSNLLNLGQ